MGEVVNLKNVIEQVGKDEGIDKAVLVEALETAMVTVAKKKYGYRRELEAHYNEGNGEIEIHEFRTVAEAVEDPETQIAMSEARLLDPECQVGDSIGNKVDTSDFGRIAAQTAKQVIMQKVRDAKREIIYNEYIGRKGDIVTGVVRKFERGDIYVDIGKAEAILPRKEQLPGEMYKPGARIQGVIIEVHKISRGPQVILSRSHESYLMKLFEMEVPEIYEGIVKIFAAAREPGVRAKIAVYSKDSDVDPVGACVGMKGSRVQSVVSNLRGEKIDIVPYDPDPIKFVCNAIAPAEVSRIRVNEAQRTMELIVAEDQLSLAIGKRGQNVRLASKLTGWRLDIVSEEELARRTSGGSVLLRDLPWITGATAEILKQSSVETMADFLALEEEKRRQLPGFTPADTDELYSQLSFLSRLRDRTEMMLRELTDEAHFQAILKEWYPLIRLAGVGPVLAKRLAQEKFHRFEVAGIHENEMTASRMNLPEPVRERLIKALRSYHEKLEQVKQAADRTEYPGELFDAEIRNWELDQLLTNPQEKSA